MKAAAATLSFLLMLPIGASAATLYDGSERFVQAHIDIGVDRTSATGSAERNASRFSATTSLETGTASPRSYMAGVGNEEELAAYKDALEANAYIEEAEASLHGQVAVTYAHPATLFGIFPVSVKSRTTVKINDGGLVEAKTRMPWWSIFAAETESLAASIDAELANSGEIITNMKLAGNAAARARVLEAVATAHARALARTSALPN
jgi:hypothetical protein